jgi:hypothetical protein
MCFKMSLVQSDPTYLDRNCSNEPNFVSIVSLSIWDMLVRVGGIVVFRFRIRFDEGLCRKIYYMREAPARLLIDERKIVVNFAPNTTLFCIKCVPCHLCHPI